MKAIKKTIKKIVFFLMNRKIDFVLFQAIAALLFIVTNEAWFAYAWTVLATAFLVGFCLSVLMRNNLTIFTNLFLRS